MPTVCDVTTAQMQAKVEKLVICQLELKNLTFKNYLFKKIYIYVFGHSVCMCMTRMHVPWRPEEGNPGGCKQSYLVSGNLTWIYYKNDMWPAEMFQPINALAAIAKFLISIHSMCNISA